MSQVEAGQGIFDRPRHSVQSMVFILFAIWQTMPAVLGLLLFMVARALRFNWKTLLPIGVFLALLALYFEVQDASMVTASALLKEGWQLNINCWRQLATQHEVSFLYTHALNFLVGVSAILMGLLSLLELIPNSAHEHALRALQKGLVQHFNRLPERVISKTFDRINEDKTNGVALGVSLKTGKAVVMPDKAINQVTLVLGTTGSGKTITLRRFYQRAAQQGYPLIIVDAKPDDEQIAWVTQLAKQWSRPFFGFNCGNHLSYNVLKEGGFTELKDKIICLKDEWSSDYYRSIAEDYLQTIFGVLIASSQPYDLHTVLSLLDYAELALFARKINQPYWLNRVKSLSDYEGEELKGLRAHFQQLIHSELGHYLANVDNAFSLRDVIEQNGIVYFALPALKYPSFAKMLGKLVINDIKSLVERGIDGKKLFTIFDEFSVFAGDQVLNLVNMGRGKGVHAIFGTQGVGDLQSVSPQFAEQVLNCVNTLIAHRVNDQSSAEMVAAWSGSKDDLNVTAQITTDRNTGAGSVKKVKEFVVHPDILKRELQTGEAVYISKCDGYRWDLVRVKYS